MGKYGKKKIVSEDIFDYNIGVIGESGIGKTTVIKEVCEIICGDDGYIAFNVGKEDGHDAISDIISEDIPTYKKFYDVTGDIIKNKETDYKDLKVIIIDTIDQLFEITEPEVVRLHNVDNPEKRVSSIKAAFGGFMAGEDKVIELILNRLWELKKVGVSFCIIGHTKKRDIEDVVTGQTYSTLTTNMSQRYFNAIKTKLHILGVASINREIVQEKTGKKNIVTHKEEVKGKVKSESRRITFRDDNYSIDSKSRFADIVNEIPLNANEFINALKNAIDVARSKAKSPNQETDKLQDSIKIEPDNIDNINIDVVEEEITENIIDIKALVEDIREKFKNCKNKEVKDEIKLILSKNGGKLSENIPLDVLNNIIAKLS